VVGSNNTRRASRGGPRRGVDHLVVAWPDAARPEGEAVCGLLDPIAVSGGPYLLDVRTADREQNTGGCHLALLGLCELFADWCT
jgi:hypothetical protein